MERVLAELRWVRDVQSCNCVISVDSLVVGESCLPVWILRLGSSLLVWI